MKILKFGGTSLATPERLTEVLKMTYNEEKAILVLSAVSGTTNALQEIANKCYVNEKGSAYALVSRLREEYNTYMQELLTESYAYMTCKQNINQLFEEILQLSEAFVGVKDEKELLAYGELLSTKLAWHKANELYPECFELISAFDFISTDEHGEPNLAAIKSSLNDRLSSVTKNLLITQGYICMNSSSEVDNLRRGGSDYTASLIGEAVQADEIQIWTDIDGMHNNDPRVVEDTEPIRRMSYDEAAELAYFGAKILHPQCVFPAQRASIPLRLKYTMDSSAEGTLVSDTSSGTGVKAIAAKDGITAIKIKSSRMLMAYGFLRQVFEIFEKHRTSIDMITTSEVAVSLTIDNNQYLNAIIEDLNEIAETEIDTKQSIICIVGDLIAESKGHAAQIFEGLHTTPIRMVSYGGSKNNVSILINESDKSQALNALHQTFFQYAEV